MKKWTMDTSALEFSLFSGTRHYVISRSDLGKSDFYATCVQQDAGVHMILLNEDSTPMGDEDISWFQKLVEYTMPQNRIEWPVDMAEISVMKLDESHPKTSYLRYMVFPMPIISGTWILLRDIICQPTGSDVLDWRNEEIQKYCLGFLDALSWMHEMGYAYNDFSPDRILFQSDTGKCYFKFHSGIQPLIRKMAVRPLDFSLFSKEFFPSSYLEDEVGTVEKKKNYRKRIDEETVPAVLFRMMIGKLPYEGEDMSAYGDILNPDRPMSAPEREIYFQHYHQRPVFIFDPDNHRNQLPDIYESRKPRERWESLSPELKTMFVESFKKDKEVYTVKRWMRALSNLYRIKERGTGK